MLSTSRASAPVSVPVTDGVTWRDEAIQLAVLYRLLECGEVIPVFTAGTDYAFIEQHLDRMHLRDLLRIDGTKWVVTKKGKETFATLVKMYDQVIKFEVFSAVNLVRELGSEECQVAADDASAEEKWRTSLLVLDYVYDPRFQPSRDAEDLRLAMITFMAESMQQRGELANGLDPHRVVFIQKLIDGKLRSKTFWADLRTKFLTEIDEIVTSAYAWRDIANTEDQAAVVMEQLYRAGMLEQRKRDGNECSRCKIPLAVFALLAKEDGQPFDQCPNPECQASFAPPPAAETGTRFECPNCRASIGLGQRYCTCGARVDFSLPPGTVETSTVETTEVVEELAWGYDTYYTYEVVPYGYYTPWNPWADVAAFCILAAVLW